MSVEAKQSVTQLPSIELNTSAVKMDRTFLYRIVQSRRGPLAGGVFEIDVNSNMDPLPRRRRNGSGVFCLV